jgi:hypothetical protein
MPGRGYGTHNARQELQAHYTLSLDPQRRLPGRGYGTHNARQEQYAHTLKTRMRMEIEWIKRELVN